MSEIAVKLLRENAVRIVLLICFLIGQYFVIKKTIQENTINIEHNTDELATLELRVTALDLDLNLKVARMIAIQERNTEDIQRILRAIELQNERTTEFYQKYGGVLNRID